ncbi:MAG TPA: YaaL family protein [Candidatus Scatovivens faecipullorum]|jgi:hypothetical protein|nr:YaaL family protein [Candidatus Scatovivens faecipullorum]
MYDEFVKEAQINEKTDLEKNNELLQNIIFVKNSLANMYNNLQFADSDLIDYYTYQIKAEEAKYNYLIKQAKKKKLNVVN